MSIDPCGICWSNHDSTSVPAHDGLHLFHLNCLQDHVRKSPMGQKCPLCKQQIDFRSLKGQNRAPIEEGIPLLPPERASVPAQGSLPIVKKISKAVAGFFAGLVTSIGIGSAIGAAIDGEEGAMVGLLVGSLIGAGVAGVCCMLSLQNR